MNKSLLLCIVPTVILSTGSGEARAATPKPLVMNLAGSVWCQQSSRPISHVTSTGGGESTGDFIEGTESCFVLQRMGDQLAIFEHWVIKSESTHIIKNGIATPISGTSLVYQEADTPDISLLPSIKVGGTLTVRGKYLDMTQLGHMKDGSVAGYNNRFVRVKRIPFIPEN